MCLTASQYHDNGAGDEDRGGDRKRQANDVRVAAGRRVHVRSMRSFSFLKILTLGTAVDAD